MNTKTFSIGDSLREGWRLLWSNAGVLLPISLIPMALSYGTSYLAEVMPKGSFVAIALTVAGVVLQIIFMTALFTAAVRIVREGTVSWNGAFSHINRVLGFLVGHIVYSLIVIGGLILLIVPGLIWAMKYSLFPYAFFDKNIGWRDALRKSAEVTNGVKWKLFGFSMLISAIFLVLAVLIGILIGFPLPESSIITPFNIVIGLASVVLTPVFMIAMAAAYKTLDGYTQLVPEAEAPAPEASSEDVAPESQQQQDSASE